MSGHTPEVLYERYFMSGHTPEVLYERYFMSGHTPEVHYERSYSGSTSGVGSKLLSMDYSIVIK